jgi:peptidyl-prolyl cis-trans isomerase SurA
LNGRRLLLAFGALAAFSLPSCRSTPPPAAAAPPVTADTWAVVDGKPITREAVDKAFRRLGNTAQPMSDEEAMTARLSILNDLILQEVLIGRAAALKVELPDTELETAYNNAKKNISDDAFQQELSKRSLTAADMREGLRRDLLAQKVIEKEVTSNVSVTDQEVTDFFNGNKAQFNIPEESYRLAQIVVTPVREAQVSNGSGDDAATPEAAAAKVRMLMDRLKAGASFRDLAVGYSEDPETGTRGGDLGLVPLSRLKQAPPALRNAVLGKEPGTVNVASYGGAHTLVLVVGHEQAGQRDLSTPAVRDNITSALRGRKEELLRAAYLTAARTDADVVNYLARRLVEAKGKPPAQPPALIGGK